LPAPVIGLGDFNSFVNLVIGDQFQSVLLLGLYIDIRQI
jgi:hypothetical protein